MTDASPPRAALPTAVLDRPDCRADEFFRFAYERQAAWHRRVVEGRPAPWTDDPILRANRFTNVHRELDRGTRFLQAEILDRRALPADRFWNTMIYRLWNKIETWEECVGWVDLDEWVDRSYDIFVRLEARRRRDDRLFTGAHQPLRVSGRGETPLQRLYYLTRDEWLPDFHRAWPTLENAARLEEVQRVLGSFRGFADFRSYQLALDLTLIRPDISTDDWALAGPGAKKGLKIVFPWARSASALEAMHLLRGHQEAAFERLEIDWSSVAWPERPRMNLMDIEHTLCEFSKYIGMRDHGRRGRRLAPAA